MNSVQKKCSKCGETKTSEAFNKESRAKDGLHGCCRECSNEKQRKWCAGNPEKIRAQYRRWQDAHPGAHRDQQRIYRKINRVECRERCRKHYAANREKKLESCQKARAKRQTENYSNLIQMFGPACVDCGREYPAQIFHYHHENPNLKKGELHVAAWKWDRVEAYVKDTIQLCPTCHSLRHHLERETGGLA